MKHIMLYLLFIFSYKHFISFFSKKKLDKVFHQDIMTS